MTHPLSSGWTQPDPRGFKFFEMKDGGLQFVSVTEGEQKQMLRYDLGFPSGVYEGKMWLCDDHLVWFDISPTDPNSCVNLSAKIISRQKNH